VVILCNLFSCDADGGNNQAAADTLPRFPRTTLTVQLDADIKTNVDLAILTPAYTFATPVWGGRLGFNLFVPVGTARTEIDALVTGALGPIGFANQNSVSERLTSFGDPAPQLSLKWNKGVNNFMLYSRGGIPIGDYDPDRIVNLGDGHASWDNGFGYTFFNATTGLEFSAVSGLTYNFRNPHTDYKNGIDWHVDLEASRFLTKQFYVGAVGYSFNQLTGDSGSGATLGPYISRISAVGPEVGVLFPVGGMQGSLNLRLGLCSSKSFIWLEYVAGVFDCAGSRKHAQNCKIRAVSGRAQAQRERLRAALRRPTPNAQGTRDPKAAEALTGIFKSSVALKREEYHTSP